jgi:hypothetical protein
METVSRLCNPNDTTDFDDLDRSEGNGLGTAYQARLR